MGRSTLSKRATVAALTRHHPDDTDAIEQARTELQISRAEDLVRQIVDAAPPLPAEARDKLALILRGGGGAAA